MSLRTLCALSVLNLFIVATLAAAEPNLGDIAPYGVQRGKETEVVFRGARLADAQGLLLYSPGIAVASIEAKDNEVKAKLNVAADCRLGIHAVRIRTASGVSNLMTFTVGQFPEVAEVEPNSEFTTPQAIGATNVTVSGIVQGEDVDYFVIDAKKGERISVELEGLRLGRTNFDPYVAIMNSARFELASSDDAALLWQDGVCAAVAPEDGKYIIQVRESAYGGDGNCKYRLHLGSFPRPTAVYPCGGNPGQSLEVTWLGMPGGPWKQQITLPAAPEEKYGLYATDAGGMSPSPNVMRVNALPNTLEAEPNNDAGHATAAAGPGALNGIIQVPGDIDCFKFHATKGATFDVRVHARNPHRSPLDSSLSITRASNGAGVAGNDDSGGPDSYVRFQAPEEDDYIVTVRDHLNAGGEDFVYRVEVSPVVPSIVTYLPERQQYVPVTLSIPKGNRMALMFGARRNNMGGDLTLDFKDLPAGVTFEALPMTANRSEVAVLFTAAADATPNGTLADVSAKANDPNLNGLTGHLAQRSMLVRGNNNTDVWGHDADRMAVALTQEVPFKLEIVQPKAPLVRNGQMDLKIVATRAEGFKAPINVFLLYNPPGVASSGSINIAEGANEATIPLTANGGAEIGKFRIVVIGKSSSVEAATQFAELEVADTFFDVAFEKAACEQGQDVEVVCKVTKKKDFEGNAKAELVGLPPGATVVGPVEFNKDATEFVFAVKTAKDAREGRHTSLICRTTIMINGEPVLHTNGGGELRIDKPLPPKVAPPPMPAPMATPAPMPMAEAPKPPPMKRLSRLEQLRLEREMQQGGK